MMKEQLKEKTKESLASVLPITVIVFLLSATVVPMETGTLLLFLIGAMLLIVGMGIFQLGAELAMTPLGQSIGSRMIKGNKLWATVLICFFMGAIITIAEPDLQVLANQVASIPNNVLIYTVAGGVGIFLVIAFLRILYRISLSQTLTVLYILRCESQASASYILSQRHTGHITKKSNEAVCSIGNCQWKKSSYD